MAENISVAYCLNYLEIDGAQCMRISLLSVFEMAENISVAYCLNYFDIDGTQCKHISHFDSLT